MRKLPQTPGALGDRPACHSSLAKKLLTRLLNVEIDRNLLNLNKALVLGLDAAARAGHMNMGRKSFKCPQIQYHSVGYYGKRPLKSSANGRPNRLSANKIGRVGQAPPQPVVTLMRFVVQADSVGGPLKGCLFFIDIVGFLAGAGGFDMLQRPFVGRLGPLDIDVIDKLNCVGY